MKQYGQKILYHISKWYEGTAYKNINFMKDNFGGVIIKDDTQEVKRYIEEEHPDFMVVRGDNRTDYKIAMRYKIPYLLIENDISSMRIGPKEGYDTEREMIENASAMILTSEGHADYLIKKRDEGWNVPYFKIIHTRPLAKDLEGSESKQKLPGLNLVYAGGIMPGWTRNKRPFGYRCYHEIFTQFIKAGWNVHIYSASYNTGKLSEYKGIGCVVHETMEYKKLLQEMTRYTAGFHGYNKDHVPALAYQYTQECIGNKVWDYLAAWIPTIGFQGGRGMKIYNNKWGIILRNIDEKTIKGIPDRLGRLKITEKMREQNVMDKDLNKYKKIVNKIMRESKEGKMRKYYSLVKLLPIKDNERLKNNIRVRNKGVVPIYRGGYTFQPGETTKEMTINMRTYKEIKSHISLVIEIVE